MVSKKSSFTKIEMNTTRQGYFCPHIPILFYN